VQQLANSENEQLVAQQQQQQQQLNNSGVQSMWQNMQLVAAPSSHSKSLLPGQPLESRFQPAVADVGYQSKASGAASSSKPGSESASGGIENMLRVRSSKSEFGGASPQMSADDASAGGQQSYLDGTFEGGWQSNADLPVRRGVIFSIVKLIEQMRPDADKMSPK
jgi:hypothetical protein